MDNFKQLLFEGEDGFDDDKNLRVYKRVSGSLDTFRFLGEIVDMYFPKMVDTLIGIVGGEEQPLTDTNDNRPTITLEPTGPKGN